MTTSKVFVVVDEATFKFIGVYPSLELASAASMPALSGDDDSVLILTFDMYESSLRNKTITVEEILNGKNEQ